MLTDAGTAAGCALDLREAVAAIDQRAEGPPDDLALRLGGHVGPVFPVRDRVLDADNFRGTHATRTARSEPITPPGEVYVTEAFAVALALAGSRGVTCDYVGHMAAAKSYEMLGMFGLRRAGAGIEPMR
jgi:class 3 adenylate cyclase